MKISSEIIEQIINGKLSTLAIQGESLKAEDIALLASALENPGCRLTELHLNYTDMTNETVKPLYEALKKNKTIHVLDLKGNQIGGEHTEALSELLEINQTIKSLQLSRCGLTPLSIMNISNGFKNRSFELLDLSDNEVGYYGVKYLVASITYAGKLNLSLNRLRAQDADIPSVIELLLSSKKIAELDLSFNNLSLILKEDFLKKALKNNTTLNSLCLKCIGLTLQDAVNVTSALKESKALTAIDLGANYLINNNDPSLFKRFIDNLAQNSVLKSIGFEGNSLYGDDLTTFIDVIERNPRITSFTIEESACNPDQLQRISVALERNKKHISLESISIFSSSDLKNDSSKPTISEELKYDAKRKMYYYGNNLDELGSTIPPVSTRYED